MAGFDCSAFVIGIGFGRNSPNEQSEGVPQSLRDIELDEGLGNMERGEGRQMVKKYKGD
jgi:hypothetical protein